MEQSTISLIIGIVATVAAASSWIFSIWVRRRLIKQGLDANTHAIKAAQWAAVAGEERKRIEAARDEIKLLRGAVLAAEPRRHNFHSRTHEPGRTVLGGAVL